MGMKTMKVIMEILKIISKNNIKMKKKNKTCHNSSRNSNNKNKIMKIINFKMKNNINNSNKINMIMMMKINLCSNSNKCKRTPIINKTNVIKIN